MKKLRIINISCLAVALILQIIPYGISLKWEGFFFESITYHSYFDSSIIEKVSIAPMLCGIFTSILVALIAIAFFVRVGKLYLFSTCAVGLAAVILSIIPAFYSAYTLMGLIASVLLAASMELTVMMYLELNKK